MYSFWFVVSLLISLVRFCSVRSLAERTGFPVSIQFCLMLTQLIRISISSLVRSTCDFDLLMVIISYSLKYTKFIKLVFY